MSPSFAMMGSVKLLVDLSLVAGVDADPDEVADMLLDFLCGAGEVDSPTRSSSPSTVSTR
jgi:hypothetical protein